MAFSAAMLGVIGGSGLYDLPDLLDRRELDVPTPYGSPSDRLVVGRLGDVPVAFVPRHGRGHRHSPSGLPYRANIYALKQLGATHVLSVSAVGSLQPALAPLHLLVPDGIIDRTTGRARTFFDAGVVAHVGLADPFCPNLRSALLHAAGATGQAVHADGAYVCIEGPQFSTKAESELHRSWGAAVVGMTAMPEARLAREAELPYATLAMVTDYDVWHESEAPVSVEIVTANLAANIEAGRQTIRHLAANGLPEPSPSCADALAGAIMTDPSLIGPEARRRLGILVDRYLPAAG